MTPERLPCARGAGCPKGSLRGCNVSSVSGLVTTPPSKPAVLPPPLAQGRLLRSIHESPATVVHNQRFRDVQGPSPTMRHGTFPALVGAGAFDGPLPWCISNEAAAVMVAETLTTSTEQNCTHPIDIGGGGSALESAHRVSLVYLFTKRYTKEMANGLSRWQAQRSGLPSERRSSGMDEGWAATQTGMRDMKLATTTELRAETPVRGDSSLCSEGHNT